MCAPEKSGEMGARCSRWRFLSGPLRVANIAKVRPFSHISGQNIQSFSALETTWRREVNSNPGYAFCNANVFSKLGSRGVTEQSFALCSIEGCNRKTRLHLGARTYLLEELSICLQTELFVLLVFLVCLRNARKARTAKQNF